jgi:hypothetical protein
MAVSPATHVGSLRKQIERSGVITSKVEGMFLSADAAFRLSVERAPDGAASRARSDRCRSRTRR